MNDTDNATTWRDFANNLTSEQFGKLDAAAWMADDDRLYMARHYAQTNQSQTTLAHVPVPAGCRIGRWFDVGGTVARTVDGAERQLATVTVRIVGQQDATGITTMGIEVRDRTDDLMTAGDARALAAALIEAADMLDRLTGDAPPSM